MTQVLTRKQESGITVWAFSQECGNDNQEMVKFGSSTELSSSVTCQLSAICHLMSIDGTFFCRWTKRKLAQSRKRVRYSMTHSTTLSPCDSPYIFDKSKSNALTQLSVWSPLHAQNTSSFLKQPTGRLTNECTSCKNHKTQPIKFGN